MIKVRRINAPQAKGLDDVSILKSVKSSLLGNMYVCYFRRFRFVRTLVLWIWTRTLPTILLTYAKYNSLQSKRFSLKKLSEYSSNRQVFFPSQSVQTPMPNVFPREKNGILKLQTKYEFPEIFITTIENGTVTGASNFLNVDGAIICHDLFRCSHDYTSEELHGRFIIHSKNSLITRLTSINTDVVIENGVMFIDAVSGNYAHFLTEVLPRIFVFSSAHPNTEASFIIDNDLHPNLMQALELVVGKSVDFIGLEMGEPLLVKSLQVVSHCGYIPFERRSKSKHLTDHSDGIFSPSVLGAMRDFIISKISYMFEKENHKKIFIKRNSSYRNVSNSKEIEDILVANGFFVVEPEKLSFIEQVDLFSNAEVVVGATGAAFANLIFCKPETKIIILISDYKNMIYGYWNNMASAVGNKVTYVIGECDDGFSQLHSNFQLGIPDLLDAISD